ncbi:IS3 family transposase [Microbacterium wangruii]
MGIGLDLGAGGCGCGCGSCMRNQLRKLQKNVLNRRSCDTRDQLRIAIVTWIERTYHRRRRQKRLHGLDPIEYEAIMNTDVALAA